MSESGGVKVWWADLLTADELDEYEYTVGNLMKEHPRQGPLDWQSRLFQVVPKSDFDQLQSENQALQKRIDVLERAKRIWERRNGDSSDLMDASQEAQHYNWLDEQNEKLVKENQRLRDEKICKKHVYKTRHHKHEPFQAMCTMICVNCGAVGIPTKEDLTIYD